MTLTDRARHLIPGGSQTMSKGPTQWAQGIAPDFIVRGSGARVWDDRGREFLDWPMALGPIMLGHGFPAVDDAIRRQLQDGITFTLPHPLEVEVAERIVDVVPCAERVRFAKSGSDATSAAIRLARAVTGRETVVSVGYHGWHDWYIGSTSRSLGVPESVRALVRTAAYGEVPDLEGAAAVILEPASATEPAPGYLQALADAARAAGALVIYDEIITGFRLALGGAQEHYGVTPDLACFGKALGNGMPISALAGKAEYMDVLKDVFFSGTHGGEALSLAAARAVIDTLRTEPVHEHLWRLGARLQAEIGALVERHGVGEWVSVGGAAPWTLVLVSEPAPDPRGLPAKTLLQQELLKRGVLYNGSHFVSYAHTDADVDETVAAYDEALGILAQALPGDVDRFLEAEPLGQVFRAVK
jgi:glutamate-1-semialdehyde aminotransferase